jgi:hypothetical protein
MVSTSTNPSSPGKVWLGMTNDEVLSDDQNISAAALQFGDPIQLTAGSNKIGVLEIIERRTIKRSVLEMIGLTRVCNVFLLPSTPII